MISVGPYIARFPTLFAGHAVETPWLISAHARTIIQHALGKLGPDYKVFNEVAIHKSVVIDSHAILKGPAIISANCFIGAHTYLRGGVFLDEEVSLGPGCEIKSSLVFAGTALGHFNFVGDSLIGAQVNLEAGAVVANHYNERKDKNISCLVQGNVVPTGLEKFGALIGDRCKVGANAVLSPGTILTPDTVVKRLELIDQIAAQRDHPSGK